MRKGEHRYLRCWVLASSPGTTVSREVKQVQLYFNFQFSTSTSNNFTKMQIKINFKSASRMEAQLSRKIKTKTAFRSSQSEEDRGSNSTELILLCGDGGPEEVGGEAGGSLVGRHLRQH